MMFANVKPNELSRKLLDNNGNSNDDNDPHHLVIYTNDNIDTVTSIDDDDDDDDDDDKFLSIATTKSADNDATTTNSSGKNMLMMSRGRAHSHNFDNMRMKKRRSALFLNNLVDLPTRGVSKDDELLTSPKNIELDMKTRDMNDMDRLELAALWFKDALHFRTTFYMTTKERRLAHRLLHQKLSRIIRKINILIHLLLAIFEYPTETPFPYGVCPSIELCCCGVYTIELLLHLRVRGSDMFMKNPWLLAKCICLFITLCDTLIFGFGNLWIYRPLRLLRAFYLVENSRDLRLNVAYFWRIMPNLLSVLGLLVLIMVVYTIVGLLLFGGWTQCDFNAPHADPGCVLYPNYFDTFFMGFMRLFELLTTVNFPDIMLPAFKRSSWYSLYFISFLLIGLYFLMNVILAVVLFSYRRFLKVDYESKMMKQRSALMAVFCIVCNSKNHQIMKRKVIQHTELCMDRDTFEQLLRAVYPRRTHVDAGIIFEVLDTDHSGMLQFEEFVNISATISHYLRFQMRQERHRRLQSEPMLPWVSKLRHYCRRVVTHRYFHIFINLAIIGNCVTVLIEAWFVSHGRFDNRWIYSDITFCMIFMGEIALSMIAKGFHKYWQLYWNRFDVFIVGVGIIAAILTYPNIEGALVYRALIMLRIISRVPFFQELLDLVGRLLNPFAINFVSLFALYYVFAILGMWLFAGRLPKSRPDNNINLQHTLYEDSINYEEVRFDSFGRTLTILFSLMVVNNWHVIFSGVVAVTSQWCALYFISFYILCVAVIVNVIVAFFVEIFTSRYDGGEIDDTNVASITEWKIMNMERANRVIRQRFLQKQKT